jgi:hypothetical protein
MRHDVVVLEPKALERGMLLSLNTIFPGNSVRIEQTSDLSDASVDHGNPAVTAPVSIAIAHSCLDSWRRIAPSIPFWLWNDLRVAVWLPHPNV